MSLLLELAGNKAKARAAAKCTRLGVTTETTSMP